jgi:hypothetical protein
MKRETLVFIFGFLLVFMPFLGVPSAWKRIVYVVIGALLVIIGYQLRRAAYLRSIPVSEGEYKTDVYVESRAPKYTPVVAEVPVEPAVEPVQEVKVRRTRTKRV